MNKGAQIYVKKRLQNDLNFKNIIIQSLVNNS